MTNISNFPQVRPNAAPAATLGLTEANFQAVANSYDAFSNPSQDGEIILSTIGWDSDELAQLAELTGARAGDLEEQYLIIYVA